MEMPNGKAQSVQCSVLMNMMCIINSIPYSLNISFTAIVEHLPTFVSFKERKGERGTESVCVEEWNSFYSKSNKTYPILS